MQEFYARRRGVPKKRLRDPEHLKLGKKECFDCDLIKPISGFSPVSRGYAGVSAYCRKCSSRRRSSHPMHRANVYRWRLKNREKYLAQHSEHQHRRRASVSDGTVTIVFTKKIYSQKRCYYCRRLTIRSKRTIDHKIPLSRYGRHSRLNIVMACSRCNSRKSAMTVKEFMTVFRASKKAGTWACAT